MNDLSLVKGVGEATLAKFATLGIGSVRELLFFLPSSYADLKRPVPLREAEDGEYALLEGEVMSVTEPSKRGKKSFSVRLKDRLDGRGMTFSVTFFNQPYYRALFAPSAFYRFLGQLQSGPPPLVIPVFARLGGTPPPGFHQPHPLKGLIGRNSFVKIVKGAFDMANAEASESARKVLEALRTAHFPSATDDVGEAVKFLAAYDLAAGVATYRKAVNRGDSARVSRYALAPTVVDDYVSLLDVVPTESQTASFRDILSDLLSGRKMARVISGDVGSGKTLAAFFAAYATAQSGRQCVVMAPTEILAAQHAGKFGKLADKAGIRFGLLTSSTPKAEAEELIAGLADGGISVVFGTQSLLSERVGFRDLALAVIDEQHKFGVAERAELQNKGAEDVLTLTATPIPRSLALALYDDIAVSRITKREDAATDIITRTVTDAKLPDLVDYVARECKAGKQAFIVCPSIRDSEGFETLSVESFVGTYSARLEGVSYAVLHGRMNAEQKRETMSAFTRGELSLLVATSVVEVGVDTRASIMCVLAADRFGLASLHQLRGRVGRDGSSAYCFLHVKHPTERALRRLDVLVTETDGDRIAERDLELRGAGEILGARQSGATRTPCLGLPLTAEVLAECRAMTRKETEEAAEFFSDGFTAARLAEFAERAAQITFDS